MKKTILIIAFINTVYSTMLFSSQRVNSTHIPELLTTAILMNECLKEGDYCNPYIISLNSTKDKIKAKKNGFKIKHRRNIYCYNVKKCVETVKKLQAIKINNLDLGPFQISIKYNKLKNIENYFIFNKAKKEVQKILANLINKFGYSWYTIGRYNSGTKRLNKIYCNSLWKNIKKIQKKIN